MLALGMWFHKVEFNPKAVILTFVYITSSVIVFIFQKKINTYHYNFVFNVTAAASLFLLFNKLNFQNKGINFASKSCFAIFCIHTGVFANIVWRQFLITEKHFQEGLFLSIVWMVTSVVSMFVCCLVISIFFRIIFSRLKNYLLEKLPVREICEFI